MLATPSSIEIGGLKVSGSAGRLGRRAALHQATVILDLSEVAPLSLLRRRTEGGRPTADPEHRVTSLMEVTARTALPSPPAGEGGPAEQGRMKGGTPSSTSSQAPSSVSASHCHLLPQGEKVARRFTSAFATTFNLVAEPALPSPAELARADAILAETVGRDDFVFAGDVAERRAA